MLLRLLSNSISPCAAGRSSNPSPRDADMGVQDGWIVQLGTVMGQQGQAFAVGGRMGEGVIVATAPTTGVLMAVIRVFGERRPRRAAA
jgi:hypothetical protein